MISEQLDKGEEYNKIQKVVSIIIAAEHILVKGDERFHHKFLLTDRDTNSVFTDKIEVDTLEIMKMPKKIEGEGEELVTWLDFMKAKTKEELGMIATYSQANAELLKAVNLVKDLNADEYTRRLAEQREKYWRDYKSSIKEADIKGFTRGKAEGEEGKAIEIALKSLSEGLEPILISRLTNLSLKEIEALKGQMRVD